MILIGRMTFEILFAEIPVVMGIKTLSGSKINSILAFWPFNNFNTILKKLSFNVALIIDLL